MAKRLKISRKDLFKEQDQFLSGSEKAMLYFMENRSTVIGVVATIVIAGASFLGLKYYNETRTLRDEAFYFEITKIVDSAENSASDARTILEKMDEGPQKERASLLLGDIHFQNQEYDKAEALTLITRWHKSVWRTVMNLEKIIKRLLVYSSRSLTPIRVFPCLKCIGAFQNVTS